MTTIAIMIKNTQLNIKFSHMNSSINIIIHNDNIVLCGMKDVRSHSIYTINMYL